MSSFFSFYRKRKSHLQDESSRLADGFVQYLYFGAYEKRTVLSLSVCLKFIANFDIDVNLLFVNFFDFSKNIISQPCE